MQTHRENFLIKLLSILSNCRYYIDPPKLLVKCIVVGGLVQTGISCIPYLLDQTPLSNRCHE